MVKARAAARKMETERDEMQKWVVMQAAVKVELQEMRDCEERSAKIAKVGEGSAALDATA
jgi:hypothetical protein